jgi:hypothetical protein
VRELTVHVSQQHVPAGVQTQQKKLLTDTRPFLPDVKRLIPILAFLLASAAGAATHFVHPAEGAQVIGPQVIEVATDVAAINRVEFFVDDGLVGVARSAPWRIGHDFGLSTSSRRIEAKVWSDAFRRVESVNTVTRPVAAEESVTVDLVEVPLRLRAGAKVRAADLRIRENGKTQVIRELLPQRAPGHFVFVVDRSLSMGDGKLEATFRAIDKARLSLRSGDTASIVLFNHNVAKARPLARDDRVAELLRGTIPSGGTSLRDALTSLPAADRTWAIVISDGSDRNSTTGVEAALRAVSGTKTVVNGIIFGSSSDFLEKAAANTGGTVLRARRADVEAQLAHVIADINSRYVAVYQSSGGARGWRAIDVSSQNRRVAVASARKGYFAR